MYLALVSAFPYCLKPDYCTPHAGSAFPPSVALFCTTPINLCRSEADEAPSGDEKEWQVNLGPRFGAAVVSIFLITGSQSRSQLLTSRYPAGLMECPGRPHKLVVNRLPSDIIASSQ